jgi:hypothetical protein
MTRFWNATVAVCAVLALAGCGKKPASDPSATAAPAATPAAVPMVEVTAKSLNLRANPSTTGAVLASLKQGEQVSAPQPEANGWQYVETSSGAKGYVSSQYVRPVAGSAPPAAAPAATPAPAPAATPAPAAEPAANKEGAKPPPAGSTLAKVTNGMTEAQVIAILGEPTSQQNYVTGKAFIPMYYGTDTSRLDYRYKGVGIVVFSRNQYSGGTKVIRVDYDPSEDGYP